LVLFDDVGGTFMIAARTGDGAVSCVVGWSVVELRSRPLRRSVVDVEEDGAGGGLGDVLCDGSERDKGEPASARPCGVAIRLSLFVGVGG
jgi:hypothetical protein